MSKNRFLLIFAAVFVVNFSLNNASFAIQDVAVGYKYPDYACEFCGKDTCERFNRKLFAFNLKLNKYVVRPIDVVWASIMPKYGMDKLRNAYTNVNFPVRMVSCFLQKDYKALKQETKRFLINTTLGVGGLYDPAKTKFKLAPRQEDMEQALAHYPKIKSGPYLVLPVVRGSVRDLVGKALNCPLNPCSYVLGPFAIVANAAFFINNSTYAQPIIKKVDETYADPYQIAKQVDGIQDYIKNNNLDRVDFLEKKPTDDNEIKVSTMVGDAYMKSDIRTDIKPDIELGNYNPQTPLIDSMRTVLFEGHNPDKSIWSETSVWNRGFNKKIKTSSVNVYEKRPAYKFRYILQKNKTSPLAIIYPSIGEGIHSDHSTTLAKILYDDGYSVIIQGSAFQWEFVKSMPTDYRPGLPARDADYLRIVTSKIIANLEQERKYQFGRKILVGSSFGALTALFVTAQDENSQNKMLNINECISINPPVDIFYALGQLDKYCQDWQNDSGDIKMRAAITAEKAVQIAQQVSEENNSGNIANNRLGNNAEEKNEIKINTKYENANKCKFERFPFTNDEAKLIVGFVMKQKLSDVVFAIENASRCKKCKLYDETNKMSFFDYGQKYLFADRYKNPEKFDYETSLYSIGSFLQDSNKYKIYHTVDDYFVTQEQLRWLKKQTGNKSVFLSNGSHLGFLYRQEFLDDFKREIDLRPSVTCCK